MGLLIPVLVVLILVGLVIGLFNVVTKSKQSSPDASRYELVPSVLTPAEVAFARVLFKIEMPEHVVLSKVRVADFINVRKGRPDEGKGAFYRISQKHVDFLVVGRVDFKPVLAIELDDSSHGNLDRKRRDEFVDAVYRQVGLPILHVPARSSYDLADLAAQMERLVFHPKPEGTGTKSVPPKSVYMG